MLTRLKELATQSSSANASANLDKINAEGNALINEINRIANSSEYSGTKLLNGSFGVSVSAGGATTYTAAAGLNAAAGLQSNQLYSVAVTAGGGGLQITVTATMGGQQVSQSISGITAASAGQTKEVTFQALGLTLTLNENTTSATGSVAIKSMTGTASNFQVGATNTQNDRIGILLSGVRAADLGLSADQLNTASKAQTFLTTLNSAISTLSSSRGNIGAAQNRLGYASATLSTTIENATAAESVIRDVDMAAEMTSFTKNQILLQAGTAMLAQANSAPQQILALFK
jgi:flagellin